MALQAPSERGIYQAGVDFISGKLINWALLEWEIDRQLTLHASAA
jgi:hypothetical protein